MAIAPQAVLGVVRWGCRSREASAAWCWDSLGPGVPCWWGNLVREQVVVSGVPSHGQQAGPQRGALGTWEGALQLARRVRCGWGLGNLGGFFNHVGGQNTGSGCHTQWWSLCAWKCSRVDTTQCCLIRLALGRFLDLGDLQRSCPTKIAL